MFRSTTHPLATGRKPCADSGRATVAATLFRNRYSNPQARWPIHHCGPGPPRLSPVVGPPATEWLLLRLCLMSHQLGWPHRHRPPKDAPVYPRKRYGYARVGGPALTFLLASTPCHSPVMGASLTDCVSILTTEGKESRPACCRSIWLRAGLVCWKRSAFLPRSNRAAGAVIVDGLPLREVGRQVSPLAAGG